jgi:hypothetical protein
MTFIIQSLICKIKIDLKGNVLDDLIQSVLEQLRMNEPFHLSISFCFVTNEMHS